MSGDLTNHYLNDVDEEKDYNDLYAGVNDEDEGEQSEEFEVYQPEDNENESEERSESDDDEGDVKEVDLYEAWDKVVGINFIFNIDGVKVLDDALKEIWEDEEKKRHDLTKVEDDEEEDEEDEEEGEEEVDDDLQEFINSDVSSDEDVFVDSEELGSDIYVLSGDIDEDDFSLQDVNSEPEDLNAGDNDDDVDNEKTDEMRGDEIEEGKQDEENDTNMNTDDDANNEENLKRYRRLSKVFDSDSTEYKTITSLSEAENESEDNVMTGENTGYEDKTVELQEGITEEEKSLTPDPYHWIEYEKEIEVIEEYDDDFIEKYYAPNTLPSAPSSTDENDDKSDEFDLPKFQLSNYSVVKEINSKNNTNGTTKPLKQYSKNNRTKRKRTINPKFGRDQVSKTRKKTGTVIHLPPPLKDKYTIDLNVYKFDNYPKYDEEEINEWLKNGDNTESKGENKDFQNENNGEIQIVKKYTKKTIKGRDYYFLKRKQRNKIYERLHEWYIHADASETDRPDEDIPSYKATHRYLRYREKAVKVTIESMLQQTFLSIDKIEKTRMRKEGTHYSTLILINLVEELVVDIQKKQKEDAVEYGIEVLLDCWEQHVYRQRMAMIEEQMDKISEMVVTSAIKTSINDIVEEDIYSSLIIRDTMAEALKELGMGRIKINRKLGNMFQDYRFDNYDFDRGISKKIRHKVLKPRKELDSYIGERLQKKKLNKDEKKRSAQREKEQIEKEELKKKTEERKLEETKKAVLERKKSFAPQIEEKNCLPSNADDKDDNGEEDVSHSPLHISRDNSETESIGHRKDTHEYFDPVEIAVKAFQAHRRSSVVAIWTEKYRDVIQQIRKKNAETHLPNSEPEEDEEKLDEEKESDFNKRYDQMVLSEDELPEDDFYDETKLELPRLSEEVEKAFVRVVTPTKVRLINPLTNEPSESTIRSDENNEKVSGGRHSVLKRRDTGISSMSENDENDKKILIGSNFESKESTEEIVKKIPKLDRDYYLTSWLYNGVPKLPRVPLPPILSNDRKVRRLRLKRPQTALSEESVNEVPPIDFQIYAMMNKSGRLNSSLSVDRPGTVSSIYTGRDSVFSMKNEELNKDDKTREDSELSSDGENESHLKYDKIKNKQNIKRNTNIEFTALPKQKKENKTDDKNDTTPAWKFYRERQAEKTHKTQNLKKKKNEFVVYIPPKELFQKEKEALIAETAIKLDEKFNEVFHEDATDDEILAIQQNNSEEEYNSGNIAAKKKKDRTCLSVTPPSTPWKRDKTRPITPASEDSEQELDKLRDEYINKHNKNRQSEQHKYLPERRWKQYLKKTYQPPPLVPSNKPKTAFKPSSGIIQWKHANEDIKKHRKNASSSQEAQVNLNRDLFQQLQIVAKWDKKTAQQQQRNRLLERRATIHSENEATRTKAKQRKGLGLTLSSPEDSRPATTKTDSVPSFMKTTKAMENKKRGKRNNNSAYLPAIINKTPTPNEKKTKSNL